MATQHSLPSGRYSLLGPDLHRLDRTSFRLAHLFDYLVGASKQRKWHRKPERLGRLEIDGHLDFGDLLHRYVGRLITAQNPAGVVTDQAEGITIVGAVANESTSYHILAEGIDRGNSVAVGKRDELIARADKKRVGAEQERASAVRDNVRKSFFDLGWAACI